MDASKEVINIYIGYDKEEPIAYHVLVQSIIENTSCPVRITPIVKKQIAEYTRDRGIYESTDFSITRFLTPWLSEYKGWSLFIDSDFLMKGDLKDLWSLRSKEYAVMVCKHDYEPRLEHKFHNRVQAKYKRKNWSSLILFNNEKCCDLSLDYVNMADGIELHQFHWLNNEELIGEIPLHWNHLCSEDNQEWPARGIHFTNGGPWQGNNVNIEFSKSWNDMRNIAISSRQSSTTDIHIEGVDYKIIKPQFKEAGKPVDYIQLKSELNGEIYLLKKNYTKHRGIEHEYPYIYMQALGSAFSEYFKLSTQKCSIVRIDGSDWLLTLDVRGFDNVEGMEPLTLLSNKVIHSTRDLDLLHDELRKVANKDVSAFFTQMILLDTLISNNQRNARSIRLLKLTESIESDGSNQYIGKQFDFLIENNFGCYNFSKESDNPLYLKEEIISFIRKHQTQLAAEDFFQRMNPKNLVLIIEESNYLTNDLKKSCIAIITEQFEFLLSIEDIILAD